MSALLCQMVCRDPGWRIPMTPSTMAGLPPPQTLESTLSLERSHVSGSWYPLMGGDLPLKWSPLSSPFSSPSPSPSPASASAFFEDEHYSNRLMTIKQSPSSASPLTAEHIDLTPPLHQPNHIYTNSSKHLISGRGILGLIHVHVYTLYYRYFQWNPTSATAQTDSVPSS